MLSLTAKAELGPSKSELDKVVFQVSAKQWVSTQSALLTVNINATLSNADLVQVRADIMKNLNQVAAGEWQITQFERSQDSSGLEKLFVAAQARIPQANLTNIYNNAKTVTKPGATYDVSAVEFKPSLDEIQLIKTQLRERLYNQISQELERLNKVYNNQKYSVNRIFFFDGDQNLPMAKAYQPAELRTASYTAVAAAPLAVSNELIMGALVELASNRQEVNAVANH
ncbi:MAG: hypothetical protein H0U57_11720 [Tatlockia sp.]|nr:hypothetical protein [Tatlockia sp.]